MDILTLADAARLAQTRLPPAVWDFIEGGAGDERTLAGNRAAFDRAWIRPTMLAAAGTPQLARTILGRRWAAPFAVAPLAYHTLVHPDGELATVRAAGEAGVPVVVSTFAGRTFEELAGAATAPLWAQVYCFRDRAITRDLVLRAERAGFEALVVTVDTPHLGRRLRDDRNGFRLPPHIRPVNLPEGEYASPGEHARAQFDPALDWSAIDWLRSVSRLPILLKGILTAVDARRAVDAGADGLVVSNHGGRQLDGAPPTLDVLPEIVAEVAGGCVVLVDGGVRRGTDVLVALALGADGVLVGRPVLHGLAAGEQAGVARVLGILRDELTDAMSLAGVTAADQTGPELVAVAGPDRRRAVLQREHLHGSLSDPLLDTMNFLNEITMRHPQAISFAAGRPYDGFFSTEQIFDYLGRYLKHLEDEGRTPDQIRSLLYQYGPTAGQIRELVGDALRIDENIDVPAESIVVTVGAQEAMLLVLRALASGPADVLLVASPCYVGITGVARLLDVEVVPVVERPDGLAAEDVVEAIRAQLARGRRPKALYVIPDHSNPAGTTMPLPTRRALLDLAARHDILLVEDSPYRLVSPGNQLPTLKSLDTEHRVVHIGSFAKTIFPGARVGFVVADQPVRDAAGRTGLLAGELTKIKSMVTVNTSSLSQAVVAGALLSVDGSLAALNAGPAGHYGESMRLILDHLDRELPAARRAELGVTWNSPSGGFFLTMSVPFRADNAALGRSAEHFGVLWTPMSYFYPGDVGGERGIRLSTSYLTAADIEEGIARLARFVEAEVDESAGANHPAIRG
ncbi:aminotransferase class I/II-fold pyridoxal phosphate-dependent enzyme [Plantactinospora soyae]|uniref:(S)-3,5-dihydroxyphenylglycine transaminase n=1 Tax=Plantactinospora soyae TaxID=1544732 RepID=A0A927M7H9_9ACTN|nr:aminotransferase class I/II-fold pyridoxal phosphate-dependent enzyme [Plantactinospora soyae]MBE1489199.1 (S)-3,5-dihydroxyphenylglycine transaminase [Plantactinospora soyae]